VTSSTVFIVSAAALFVLTVYLVIKSGRMTVVTALATLLKELGVLIASLRGRPLSRDDVAAVVNIVTLITTSLFLLVMAGAVLLGPWREFLSRLIHQAGGVPIASSPDTSLVTYVGLILVSGLVIAVTGIVCVNLLMDRLPRRE
jgi:hypothetical protein